MGAGYLRPTVARGVMFHVSSWSTSDIKDFVGLRHVRQAYTTGSWAMYVSAFLIARDKDFPVTIAAVIARAKSVTVHHQ